MEFRLLGPVEAWHEGERLALGRRRERCVLGLLLLEPNTVVGTDRLIELLWDADPPANALSQLRVNVSRLRRLLDPDGTGGNGVRIVTRGSGYAIETHPDAIDVHRFRAEVRRAQLLEDAAGRATAAREALGLWRGQLMADSASGELRERVGPELEELRMTAVELHADAELASGRPDRVLASLAQHAARYPLRERLIGLLMRALHDAGRRADALQLYQDTRTRLAEELGVDPGDELVRAYTGILRADAPSGGGRPAPAQIPGGTRVFTGRAGEVMELVELLLAEQPAATAPPVVVVSGTAGVGKTALALHCAHRISARFPGGQLHVDLRGFGTEPPLAAADALAGFLRALGVDGASVPVGLAERSALLRTVLAGRRVLLVLDNAADAEQVRPLLPGSPSCAVVVTSRDDLAGLVARDGARRIVLDLLPPDEATGLLRALIGARVDVDPDAAARLAERSARLPLALCVAAELAASRRTVPLRLLVEELGDERRRLDLLDASGDERTAVRSVLSWSYRHLPDEAALAFRRLGLYPGRTVDHHAAAALLGRDPVAAGQVLGVLHRAHLVTDAGPDRVGMHDLLRAYAAECAGEDGEDVRRAALHRLFEHYVRATRAATAPAVGAVDAPAEGRMFAGGTAARAWLEAELDNLVAVVARAAGSGWPEHAVDLADALWRWLDMGSYYPQAVAMHETALAASDAIADPTRGAALRRHLGVILWRWGRHEEALDRFQEALRLFRSAGDRAGEADSLNNIAGVHTRWSRHDVAIDHFRRAAAIYRELGNRGAQARTASNLGVVYWQLGRYRDAQNQYLDALAILREIGDESALGGVLDNLGNACDRLGDYEAAERHHRAAYDAYLSLGDRNGTAEALDNLAGTLIHRGRPGAALDLMTRALPIMRELGDPIGEASVLGRMGAAYRLLGRPSEALEYCEGELALATATGVPAREASALNGLGETYAALNRFADSRAQHTRALELASGVGDRYEHARALAGLAHVADAEGNAAAADGLWREAGHRYDELGVPAAERRPRHAAARGR